MKLITPELEKQFAAIGKHANDPDPIVVAKFFNPAGVGTWYAVSYDPKTRIAHGYIEGLGEDEWGDFSIDELESVKIKPYGISIERDIYFKATRFSELNQDRFIDDQELSLEKEVQSELDQLQNIRDEQLQPLPEASNELDASEDIGR